MKFQFPVPHMMEVLALMQPWELRVNGADQRRVIQRAEQLGYDMTSVPEHFIIPNEHLELSGAHYPHSTVAQAFLAGATSRIRINTGVTLVPLHNPIVLAKGLATLDWMSGGRAMMTIGVGWLKEEFDLLGLNFHERGRMTDEYLAAMVELWTKDQPEFDGKYVKFKGAKFEPKPVQKPHLPMWIGGDADGALKRAARFACGWQPFLTKPEDIPARVDFIKSQPAYDGRPFEVAYGLGTRRLGENHVPLNDPNARPGMPKQEIIDRLSWFAELGVTTSAVPIPPVRDVEEYLDYAQWVMEEIKPKVP
jgi:probable F420-dependent oxidoreductase